MAGSQHNPITKADLQKQQHRDNRHANKVEKQLLVILKEIRSLATSVATRLDAIEAAVIPKPTDDTE